MVRQRGDAARPHLVRFYRRASRLRRRRTGNVAAAARVRAAGRSSKWSRIGVSSELSCMRPLHHDRCEAHHGGRFMKTQYYTATSLDGFIATEDDSLDWLFPLGDLNDTSYPAFIKDVGALAMGSATYEWMLRHADQVIAEVGSPWPYTQPTWI